MSQQSLLESVATVMWVAGAPIFDVECDCLREHQSGVLGRQLRSVIEEAEGRVILNLRAVNLMGLAAVNELIACDKECQSLGGRLVIIELTRDLARSMRSNGISRSLLIAENAGHALKLLERRAPSSRRERAA